MLRLMNKKDSGLFGGPESETETILYNFKKHIGGLHQPKVNEGIFDQFYMDHLLGTLNNNFLKHLLNKGHPDSIHLAYHKYLLLHQILFCFALVEVYSETLEKYNINDH